MNVDELLANPAAAAELPDGAVPIHAIILIEYFEPGSDDAPGSPRLTCASDEDLSTWTGVGMIQWALAVQNAQMADSVHHDDEDDDD